MPKPRHKLDNVDVIKKTATCAVCGQVDICYQNKGGGRFVWHCVKKRRENIRNWRRSEKGKEYHRNYLKQWELVNKDRKSVFNRRALLKYHGLTEADYDKMYAEREGRCDLCREFFSKLCIDHDHKTLVIRGLLCVKCNLGLGFFKDRPEVAARVPVYLAPNLSPQGVPPP